MAPFGEVAGRERESLERPDRHLMPSINLRLTDQQHQQLQTAAKTNRRSIQKEIVARLSLTAGGAGDVTAAGHRDVVAALPPAVNDPYRP